jgi:hypothetical protein
MPSESFDVSREAISLRVAICRDSNLRKANKRFTAIQGN